jgi:hypothetical protein
MSFKIEAPIPLRSEHPWSSTGPGTAEEIYFASPSWPFLQGPRHRLAHNITPIVIGPYF